MPANEREVTQLEMESWCNENSVVCCLETSAKNSSNVQEAFNLAVQYWLRMEKTADREACLCDTVDLQRNKPPENRNSCCLGSGDE